MIRGLLENLLSRRSLVFVKTEEGQDQLVNLVILEFSLQWTLHILPLIDVLLRVEEVLPVVGDVGDDGSQAPHVSRGGDVTVISQNQHNTFRKNCTQQEALGHFYLERMFRQDFGIILLSEDLRGKRSHEPSSMV